MTFSEKWLKSEWLPLIRLWYVSSAISAWNSIKWHKRTMVIWCLWRFVLFLREGTHKPQIFMCLIVWVCIFIGRHANHTMILVCNRKAATIHFHISFSLAITLSLFQSSVCLYHFFSCFGNMVLYILNYTPKKKKKKHKNKKKKFYHPHTHTNNFNFYFLSHTLFLLFRYTLFNYKIF